MAEQNASQAVSGIKLKEVDITSYPDVFDLLLGDLMSWNSVSVQLVWNDIIVGSDSLKIALQSSNAIGLPFNDIVGLTTDVNTANGSETLETFEFGGRFLNMNMQRNGSTGKLTVALIVKDK